jgi:trehalose 6-phosphate synthase/phosphatase
VAIGDDRTDEDLFASLPPAAISARVGPGATRARFRLDGTAAVRGVLQMVADAGVRADLA